MESTLQKFEDLMRTFLNLKEKLFFFITRGRNGRIDFKVFTQKVLTCLNRLVLNKPFIVSLVRRGRRVRNTKV